jgi:hemin uptake protein HemP
MSLNFNSILSVESLPPKLTDDDSRDEGRPLTPSVRSDSLFQGGNEVLIEHGEETYRLRLTRSGKLILQK